jgi:subtilisin
MACPAATGAAARLLSAHPEILAMPRDQSRSDTMARLILQTAKPLGFGGIFEGHGLIG